MIPDHILKRLPESEKKRLGKAGRTFEECEADRQAKSEKELQNQIAALLSIRGIPFIRQRMDKKSQVRVGWPDFTFCLNGKFCTFEVKMLGKNPDIEQSKVIQEILDSGGWCAVVRSCREAIKWIDEWTK